MPAIGAEFAPICTISAGNWCISPKSCAACARAPRGRVVAGGRHKSLAPFCRLAAAPVGASLSSGLDRIIMVRRLLAWARQGIATRSKSAAVAIEDDEIDSQPIARAFYALSSSSGTQ